MTFTKEWEFEVRTCPIQGCSITYALTVAHGKSLRNSGHTFYCPNGHRLSYDVTKTSDAAKLRASEARQLALQDQVTAAIRDAEATRYALLRDRQRFANGVCPCCNRTFQNVLNHMKGKHPDYDVSKVKQATVTKFPCSCGRSFETLHGLRIHQGYARGDDWDQPDAGRWNAHLTAVKA